MGQPHPSWPFHLGQRNNSLVNQDLIFLYWHHRHGINLLPVSYTHLDVYKRQKYDKTYALKKFESLKADYLKTSGNRKYFNKFIGDLCGYQQACTNLPPDIVNPILDNKFDLKKAR